MDFLYDKTFKCLYCKQKFTSKNVRSRHVKIKKVDEDGCSHYQGEANPYLYKVASCPHCGFVFTQNFLVDSLNRNIIKENYIDKLSHVDNHVNQRTIEEAIKLYKLALASAQISNQTYEIKAGLSIITAWLYRLKEDENEHKFLHMARANYIKAYENEILKGEEIEVIKKIFHISIFLEDDKTATKWMNEIYKYKNSQLTMSSKEILNELREKIAS